MNNYNLTFGEALERAKQGELMTREGWNGKGMFIFMRPADHIPVSVVIDNIKSLPASVKEYYSTARERGPVSPEGKEQGILFTPYLCMKAADNSIVNGWLASQTDMLSNDWGRFVYAQDAVAAN